MPGLDELKVVGVGNSETEVVAEVSVGSFCANDPARGHAVEKDLHVQLNYRVVGCSVAVRSIRPESLDLLWSRPHGLAGSFVIGLEGGVHVFHELLGADRAVGIDVKVGDTIGLLQTVEGSDWVDGDFGGSRGAAARTSGGEGINGRRGGRSPSDAGWSDRSETGIKVAGVCVGGSPSDHHGLPGQSDRRRDGQSRGRRRRRIDRYCCECGGGATGAGGSVSVFGGRGRL